MNRKIILASSSPRRIDIMRSHGIEPEIMPAHIDEHLPKDINMTDAVMFLAMKKALAVEEKAEPGSVIIAADTVVYKNKILGKPLNRCDAHRMISSIRDTYHYVTTGVAIVVAGETKRKAFYDVTKVFCKDYTEEDIKAYLDTDEPYDKAGAYAIQGEFSRHIDHYEGSFDNVVGFPWEKIEEELKEYL